MREFEEEAPVFRGDALGYAKREARYRRQWWAQPRRTRLDGLVVTSWAFVLVAGISFWGTVIWAIIRLVRWVVSHG
jgi:hypothetical protein